MAKSVVSPMRRLFQRKGSQENGAGRPRASGLGLSWPVLLLMGLTLLCAVVWAFVMGFLVGRGHNPETHLREMTGFTGSAPEKVGAAPEKGEIVDPEQPRPEKTELEKASAAKTEPPPRFPVPSEAALAAWGDGQPERAKTPPAQVERKKAPAQPATRNKAEQAPAQYDYEYQLAALRSEADAKKLQKKLQAQSIRTQIRKSGKVYLLTRAFRGTENTEREMLAKIKSAGLGKPLRLSRKEAPQKAPQKTRGKK